MHLLVKSFVAMSCLSIAGLAWGATSTTNTKKTGTKPMTNTEKVEPKTANPNLIHATLNTSMGVIKFELDKEKAPLTVQNFITYIEAGHFNKTIFHRVIDGFMIQGGGFDEKMTEKSTKNPITLEDQNGLKNARGTIAMARTNDPNSATAQFFINLIDNDFLNGIPSRRGYAVFGKVIEGMEVVDKIAKVKVANFGPYESVPKVPVVMNSFTIDKK